MSGVFWLDIGVEGRWFISLAFAAPCSQPSHSLLRSPIYHEWTSGEENTVSMLLSQHTHSLGVLKHDYELILPVLSQQKVVIAILDPCISRFASLIRSIRCLALQK